MRTVARFFQVLAVLVIALPHAAAQWRSLRMECMPAPSPSAATLAAVEEEPTPAPADAPYLGLLVQEEFATEGPGVSVLAVLDQGAAWRGGVEVGDRILRLGDQEVMDRQALREVLARHAIGDRLPLLLWRDGERWCTQVRLGARPSLPDPSPAQQVVEAAPVAPVEPAAVTPAEPVEEALVEEEPVLASQDEEAPQGWLGIEVEETPERTLVVVQVQPGSPADRAGLKVQDLLKKADGVRLEDLDVLSGVLAPMGPGEVVTLEFLRQDERLATKARLSLAPEWSEAVPAATADPVAEVREAPPEPARPVATITPPPPEPTRPPVEPVRREEPPMAAAKAPLVQKVAQLEAMVAELETALAARDAQLEEWRAERESLKSRLDRQDQALARILEVLKGLQEEKHLEAGLPTQD